MKSGQPASVSSVKVSILVKTLNEEANIERCLRSCIKALESTSGEIIVADSLSDDATVEIASGFPVKIVQLVHPEERSCGMAAQLGYQHSAGDYLYIIDGDMELPPEFLNAAIRFLDSHANVAGVGGQLEEIQPETHLSRIRSSRKQPWHHKPGEVDRLEGGGLYRRAAIEQVGGYLTHPGLHAFEELELARRLRGAGWRLRRLEAVSMRHAAHRDPPFALLARRWKSKYAFGSGELIMAVASKPYFQSTLSEFKFNFVIWAWWLVILTCLFAAVWFPAAAVLALAIVLFPFVVMIVRKRDFSLGVYAVASWNVFAAGMLRGLVAGKPRDPRLNISSRVLQQGVVAGARDSGKSSRLLGTGA